MSDLQFNEQNYSMPAYSTGGDESKMAQFLINKGIAKDRKSAEVILIVFAVILFIITFFVMKSNLSSGNTNTNTQPPANFPPSEF